MEKLTSYLTFKLGNEKFAANIGNVLHILGVPEITELPNAPSHIKGAFNLRGKVLTVFDPHDRFKMPQQAITKNTCVVVLEFEKDGEKTELGALVDAVEQVIEVDQSELLPPPELGTEFKSDFIENVIRNGEEFILVLNIENVFATKY
jgi:purine-binding chemotaxis protein CheW